MFGELATNLSSRHLEDGENIFYARTRVGRIRRFEVARADCLELAADTFASGFDQVGEMRCHEIAWVEWLAGRIGVGKCGRILLEGTPQGTLVETSKIPE